MIGRVFAALVIVVVAAVLLVAAWPQLLDLEKVFLVAQVVSLRGVAVAVAVLALVLIGLVALAARPTRRFLGSIMVLLLIFVGMSSAVLTTRGLGNPEFAAKGEWDVTVLSWNTLGGAADAGTVADLAVEVGADVVSLPETTEPMGRDVAAAMAAAGIPMQVYTTAYDEIAAARSTTLLIRESYGEYIVNAEAGNTAVLPTVIAEPADGNGPTIMAVHPVAPIPAEMDNWRSDLEWLGGRCDTGNVIMAGDFNATLDHMADYGGDRTADGLITSLGNCLDGAAATGNAGVGTWPAAIPSLLGTPIDHILATDGWRFTGFRVITDRDGAGSDHRPIVAQLHPLR
jgi:endonuclease/exonuclease/phosphatase (EEP) superfamily protein YafD